MLQNKLLNIPFAIILVFSIILTGCGLGFDGDGNTGTMTVMMHDAPIDSADAVNVFIERVEVNNLEDEEGWTILGEPQQSYNLLELTNGALAELGTSELETGRYEQIRLILSENDNSIVVDGTEYDMIVPSGAQTGVKLDVDAEIEAGIEYVLLLDFDASRSVVKAGQNNPSVEYLLKPVIKATNMAITGNIGGTVNPVESRAVVYALADSDTLSSTIADTTDGSFLLVGLEEGTYDVSVDPRNDNYQPETVNDNTVTIGETNDIGEIELNEN